MKPKTKIIATMMALCLTVALGVIGIFAVKTLNMTVGGNITFSADGVSFTIGNGTFYQSNETTEYTGITTQSGKMQGFAMNTNTKLADVEDEIASWTGLELALDSRGDAVLKFNIKNDMSTKQLYVLFTVSEGTNTNDNMEIICATSELIEPTENKNIRIIFDILDDSINAGLTGFKIDLTISDSENNNQSPKLVVDKDSGEVTNIEDPQYTQVRYVLNTETQTAYVEKISDDVCGNVVIMDKVYLDNNSYTVTAISGMGFYDCSQIESIVLPNTLKLIDSDSFFGSNIAEINIPNSVIEIGDCAFDTCSNLTNVVIPSSVTKMGEGVFSTCPNIKTITFKSTQPPEIGWGLFDTDYDTIIYVPKDCVDVYKNAEGFEEFSDLIFEEGTQIPVFVKTVLIENTLEDAYGEPLSYDGYYYKIDDGEWKSLKNIDIADFDGYYTVSFKTINATNSDRTIVSSNLETTPQDGYTDADYLTINFEGKEYRIYKTQTNKEKNVYNYLEFDITDFKRYEEIRIRTKSVY